MVIAPDCEPPTQGPDQQGSGIASRLPTISIIAVVLAIICATIAVGSLASSPGGADYWLPADGHRVSFTQPENSDFKFVEWSRPEVLSVFQSGLVGFSYWLKATDLDWLSTSFLRQRTIQTDSEGSSFALSDDLWTLGPDGARSAIEVDFSNLDDAGILEVSILVPGRLDLPSDLRDGHSWVSEGTAHTLTSEGIEEFPYHASYSATQSTNDAELSDCLDITMEQNINNNYQSYQRTWCPGDGIKRFTDTVTYSTPPATSPTESLRAWTPSTMRPLAQVEPEEPFDWSLADSLEFTSPPVNDPGNSDAISLDPISPPGILDGGAVFVGQILPDAYGISTKEDVLEIVWASRPGGLATASATLGGVTLVTTTNRQVVAYDYEGRWLWEAPLSDISVVPPVRFQDLAVIVALDGTVTAFELSSGATKWRSSLGAAIRSTPVVARNRVLVTNQSGALACFNASGQQVWVQDTGVPRSIAVSGGPKPVVVVGTDGSVVIRAYSLEDGHQLWRQRVYQDARNLIALDSVVVLRDDDRVLGVDWATGAVAWNWAEQRTATGVGGGQRVLLVGETEFVLLGEDGEMVRTWPHQLGDVVNKTVLLNAEGTTVLAYTSAGLNIGELP